MFGRKTPIREANGPSFHSPLTELKVRSPSTAEDSSGGYTMSLRLRFSVSPVLQLP